MECIRGRMPLLLLPFPACSGCERWVGGVPEDLSASRQSFQQALDNPCEYFIEHVIS